MDLAQSVSVCFVSACQGSNGKHLITCVAKRHQESLAAQIGLFGNIHTNGSKFTYSVR